MNYLHRYAALDNPNQPFIRSKGLNDCDYNNFEHFLKDKEYNNIDWLLLKLLDKVVK